MKVALTDNPNSGKTTLFNAITGRIEKVGNWAGVTIEKKEGPIKTNLNKTNLNSDRHRHHHHHHHHGRHH